MTLKARITAIDRFIKGLKEDGIYTDLQAACVMAGWDSLAGALTPLVGAAPTNSGLSAYDRGVGIAGDATNYLDSNYAFPSGLRNDCHMSAYISSGQTTGLLSGYGDGGANGSQFGIQAARLFQTSASVYSPADSTTVGFRGTSRDNESSFVYRSAQQDDTASIASSPVVHLDFAVFARQRNTLTPDNKTDATLAFYSFGSATGLAALDARVSTLMADLRAIEEAGFDRDAIGYLRAVEEADGAFLETSVKVAINNLVSGLKADGLWDAIGSSCLLSGPRTLAGALVPLKGDAPTAEGGWASGDYDRSTGMKGNGFSLYLDSNRAGTADGQNDRHWALYSTLAMTDGDCSFGLSSPGVFSNEQYRAGTQNFLWCSSPSGSGVNAAIFTNSGAAGFHGASRSDATGFTARSAGATSEATVASATPPEETYFVFARNLIGTGQNLASATRLAFYSIGSSLDLAKLDSHISDYVTAIGAAI
jgi:hypothetical protein